MKQKLLVLAILFSFSLSKLHAQQLKGDPWIFQAYKAMYNRAPTAWELNIKNYNNGSWNSYNDLANYILQYQSAMNKNGINVSTTTLANGYIVAFFNQNGRTIAADLITNDGGSIIAQGGGNIIAQGGGNIIAQGGGNVISPNGSNLSTLKGVSFGGRFQVQEAGSTLPIPTSGNGALIIR